MKTGIADFNPYSHLSQSRIDQEYQHLDWMKIFFSYEKFSLVKRSDETVPFYLWSGAPATASMLRKLTLCTGFCGSMPRNNLFTLFAKVVQLPEVFLGKTLVERFQSKVDGFVLCQCHIWL